MIQHRIGVVIVNYNGEADTFKCLKSLEEFFKLEDIVVVDNKSKHFNIKEFESNFPGVRFIPNSENLGFGHGNNVGINLLISEGYDLIWLLNNDTIPNVEALNEMIKFLYNDKLDAVGCKLIDSSGNLQAYGGGKVNIKLGIVNHNYDSESKNLDYLIAASVIIKSEVLKSIGGFDTEFFLYWEDTDMFLRMKELGYKFGFSSKAVIVHNESSSTGKYSPKFIQYFFKSARRFFSKHSKNPRISICGLKILYIFRMIKSRKFTGIRHVISS